MVINFSEFEMGEYDETDKAIFSIVTEQIKTYRTCKGEQAVQRLADEVVAFCLRKHSEDGFDIGGALDISFGVILDIASFVSHNDAAHDGLAQCLRRVLKHGGLQSAGKKVGSYLLCRNSPS